MQNTNVHNFSKCKQIYFMTVLNCTCAAFYALSVKSKSKEAAQATYGL